MSSKKRITSLPSPNLAHPANALIATALSKHSSHSHSSSYHSFITSPHSILKRGIKSTNGEGKKRAAPPSYPDCLPQPIAALAINEKMLTWFDGVKESRGMPWRVEVDPDKLSKAEGNQRGYEVWISEVSGPASLRSPPHPVSSRAPPAQQVWSGSLTTVTFDQIMLQQTQVSTVIPYFKKWMLAFPTVKDLAEADIETVNSIWAGLGYYSRASRLLKGAQTVMSEFDGILPKEAKELEKIDGMSVVSPFLDLQRSVIPADGGAFDQQWTIFCWRHLVHRFWATQCAR